MQRTRLILGWLAITLWAWAAGAQTLQHVRLMPQLGTRFAESAVFSPDGRYVLTASIFDTARIWDAATGQQLRSFEGQAAAFSRDGRYVLTSSDDNTAILWDAKTGQQQTSFAGHTEMITSVAFSPDGHYVLTGSEDKTARLWDAATGKQLRSFAGHTEILTSVAFSPDGHSVLTGSRDKTARLWDAATGQPLRTFEGHSGWVESAVFCPDGRHVLTGSQDKTARLWDAATGQPLRSFVGHSGWVESVAYSPDGRYLMTGSNDETARLWDAATGQQLRSFSGHTVAFSADGRSVLTASNDNAAARQWDATTGQQLRSFEGHADWVVSVAVSLDGRYVLTGSEDRTARLWDVTTGRQLRSFEGHSAAVQSVAFSPNGREVLTGSIDGTARLWDVTTGQRLQSFEGHSDWVDSVAFSPDGRSVLTGSRDKTARLWNAATGQRLLSFEGHSGPVDSVAFSSDGRYVLTGSRDKTARLWDAATGQPLRTFVGHSGWVESAVFSPDGRHVMTGSSDKTARLWDAATGQQLRSFEGHAYSVKSVAISHDGRFVLTGSSDKTACLWDAATGQRIRTFKGHSGPVNSVAFSPDGGSVVTGSDDTTTRVWDAASDKQELVSLFSFDDGGWAVSDPAGRYDASDPDRAAGLVWVTTNLRPISVGQLKNEYYTPGLLARAMKHEHLPDVDGMDALLLPPVVTVSNNVSAGAKVLNVSVMNDGGGVGQLLVHVNGRLLNTIAKPGTAAEGKSFTLPIDLGDAPFVVGDNAIRVTAYSSDNRIESHEAVSHYVMPAAAKGFNVVAPQTTANDAGKFYAIVVGTSVFADSKMNLTFPAKDAASFATGLRVGVERLYGKDKVWMRVLSTDAKTADGKPDSAALPTKKNIRAAFEEVRKLARPEDTLVVYLSGHGMMSGTNRDLYYYLTMDARTFDVEKDEALKDMSTVSSTELYDWLREPVKTMPLKQVVILDTCAAGAAGTELMKLAEKREIPPDQRRAIELLKDTTGTFILMGSAADAVSYEASKYGEGLLTYALLEGMRGTALDDGSRLGVSRWFEKASERVPDLARSIGGIQKPVIASPRGTGFPVALLTADDRKLVPLAMPMPQLLHLLCEDENQDDPLQLGDVVVKQLRALNDVRERGEAELNYIDATDDDLPGAITPKLQYSVAGDVVTVRIRLVVEKKVVAEEKPKFDKNDPDLAKRLAEKIAKMSAEL